MEGCPRSLMLNVDLKETFPTEFTPSLKTYIREHYNEDADSYKNECSQLEQLRTASIRPSRDHSGCSTLRRYYAQLQFLQSRFPMGDGEAVNVQFTWTDLYSEEPISLCDIKFEQASILHNLAALHSQLGSNEDRTAEEGMKVACTHFQSAAGVFQYLKAGSFCKVEHFVDHFANDAFFDMASGLLQVYTNVMLGQAQECLLEKSILDSRKDSLIARISMQVYEYYNQAVQFLDSQGPSYMGSRKAKLWTKNLKIKCCQYLAVAYIHMSNNADENQKFGEKVTYLKAASQKITEAQKASKGQPERTLELLQFLVDVVSNKLQGAIKDNDFIYHERVPELDTLPEIKAAPLVKPIPFQPCDSSVSGPDIFQRLIPMGAHTDASLYSEEKAKLLRRYVGSIEQQNQLLSKALSDLHIDDLLEPEGYDTLPAAIVQNRNSLQKDGSLKEVESNVEELTKIGTKVEEMLASIAKILEEDKKREKEIQELGVSMTPPPEREEFEKDLEQCRETHKKAMQTNTELVKVFKEHKHNLDLLVGPSEGLLAALPSLNIIDTPIDDGAVQRLRDLISKVELMKSQRKQLEADLRKQLEQDDITQLLVTREEGNKTLFFEVQLKKHDATCNLIQKNLDAQSKILKALTEANAKYAPTRQAVKETAQRRDDAVQAFVLSHDTFFELKEKLSRGLRFYQSLEKTVLKLEDKLKEFAENRKKTMDKIEEKEKRTKEKAKVPPARPGAEKPEHLINPPASTVPSHMATHFLGGPGMVHPGMRPGTLLPASHEIPLQPRIPGAAFPPRSFPGANSPRPADPRVYPTGPQGVTPRLPVPSGDQRLPAPHPGGPLQRQQNFPEQRIPQAPASPAAGPPIRPTVPSQPGVVFSQMDPRGPAPAEHLIHSTPRMSYPVPVASSLPPGGTQGFQVSRPGGSYQVPHPPAQQTRPQLVPGQAPGPVCSQALPSYDVAKFMPGTQPTSRIQLPPPQNWPQGQYPSTSQQQAGGHPSSIAQQPFQAPRGPYPTSQPQCISQAGSPQMFQQHIPSGQISQPLQPATSQHQPKNWPTQPFHFPKLAQQPMQPQQQFQQPQQPYQRQQQSPHQPQLQQQPLHPQQQQQQQPLPHPQQQQQPPRPLPQQQQPSHPQQQFQQPSPGQSQFPPPLQPQKVLQIPPHIQQQFQPRPPSQQQQTSQRPPFFQQQQQPSQPPQQLQHPMQQFQQPAQMRPRFTHPQQQIQHPIDPLQPTQVPQGQQQPQQQFQPQLQPQQSYQQQLQPMQPQKTPQQQYKPPLQPQPLSMQQPLQDKQIPTDRLPQQPLLPEKPPPQIAQSSLGPLNPQQIGQVPELPPKGQPQISQMPGPTLWQQQSPNLSSQQSRQGYTGHQPYAGYSQSQQPSQASKIPPQLGYPVLPEKKRSQADSPSSKSPLEGYPSQHPGGLQPAPPSSLQSREYPQPSQPLPSTGAPLSGEFSRQDSKEPQSFGGKQMPSPYKSVPYEQRRVEQGWTPGVQQPPPRSQVAYSPVITRKNSTDYGKESQYQEQTRSRLGSYPPYTGIVTTSPSSPATGSRSYSYSAESMTRPLVQGVRPSPTSLPPSSAYATSYSVSVAQAQLNQQQQMQQLQTQMLLQQQQLILQQQELLRQQQQQQHHESDQGHLTQLFQQMLQQQTKLAEMEQKLAEHERQEENLKKELAKTEHEEPVAEKHMEVADKEPPATTFQSSSSFSTSWSTGFSDHVHKKFDIEQAFNDLAKKQINEISEKGRHADGEGDSCKPAVEGVSEINMSKKDSDASEHSGEEIMTAERTEVSGGATDELTRGVDDKGTAQVIDTEVGNDTPGEETNDKSHSTSSTEQKIENSEVDSSSSAEGKPEDESQKTESALDENKEKQRRQEIEEQIQKIKELQKNAQPAPPPLPQKTKYLYEPGKMPEMCDLPLKPPDSETAGEPSKPSLYRQCGHYYDTQHSRIGQVENNDCLSEEEYIQKLSHTVETFDALVVSLSQKRENSPYNGFVHEWKALERMQESDSAVFSTQAASLNPSKNRYRDVLPWDHTRVKLTTKEGGDYINANLIKKVTPLSPDYILTQGPIAATLEDFWFLVWEQKSPVIVMLTKEVEGNRLKCHQYWPIDEGHTVVYGNIRVHMRSKNHSQAWIERIMQVQHSESDEVLVVSHLQFVGWPDHGVPHSPSDLLTYLSEVHNHHYNRDPQAERPLVVHCSAGVGRAGTFCVVYTAIRELNGTSNIVNIPKLVRIFRQHRKFTVQKKEQYEFCYRAVLFYANQFLELEKTAMAFKKSKLASKEQIVDVSSTSSVTSSVTSLSDSREQKADDVSFLGEISSDEYSSDSSREFDKEEQSSLPEENVSQSLGRRQDEEINRTDEESSEIKNSSQVTSDFSSDEQNVLHTSKTSTVSVDLPVAARINVDNSSSNVSEITDLKFAETLEIPTESTAIEKTKGPTVEEISNHDAEAKDSTVKSPDTAKDNEGESASETGSTELTTISERSTDTVQAHGSTQEPNTSSSGRSTFDDELVKGDLSEKQADAHGDGGVKVEKTKADTVVEKEGNEKREGAKVEDKEKKRELSDTEQQVTATPNDDQTVKTKIPDEKSRIVGQLKTEDILNGQQGQENETNQSDKEAEKEQENCFQGGEGSEQQCDENEEQVNEDECTNNDKEPNNEVTEERTPVDSSQSSEDDKRTEEMRDVEGDSLETNGV